MVFRQLDEIAFVGAGSTKSHLYYYSIMDANLGEEWATGARGGFHNLYVYYLFVYGIPFVILFGVFLFSIVKFFFKQVAGGLAIFLVPLLFMVMFIIMNLSNSFPLEADFGFYVGLFLGCSAAVACGKNIDINELVGNAQAN
jgi:O-antigen ligase